MRGGVIKKTIESQFRKIVLVRTFLALILTFLSFSSQGQDISNIDLLSNSLDSTKANFIFIGEEHTSAANAQVVQGLLNYLQANFDLSTFVIEFSPSEAFLYNKFLATGNKELLNGTIYAGIFNEWRMFWEHLYVNTKELNSRTAIKIIGIDFERPQTFAFAFNQLLEGKDNIPQCYDSLNKYMQSPIFKEKHDNRFPSDDDKEFMAEVRNFLRQQKELFASFDSLERSFLQHTVSNHVEGFAGNREEELLKNIKETLPKSESTFLMLIGQGHANYRNQNLAYMLRKENAYHVVSGKILYYKSELWGKGFKKLKEVDELKDRPWQIYSDELSTNTDGEFSYKSLEAYPALTEYFDYLIIAKGQKGLTY